MKIRKEIKIGFLIVVASALLFWGLNFLKGDNIFGVNRTFFALYDNVEGLNVSSAVTINGLKVGKVKSIKFDPENIGKITVEFSLEKDILIPDSSIAEIYSLDLMGTKGIQIKFINSKTYYSIGATIKSSAEQGLKEQVSKQVLPLKIKAEELMGSMDSVLTIVQYIFNKTNRSNIDKSFASIQEIFKNLKNTSITLDTLMKSEKNRLHNILANVESITLNLKTNNEQITNVLNNFSNISDSLAKSKILSTINNANNAIETVNHILQKIQRGEGTMGMLINNDSLYNNLNKSTADLDKLLIDLRENPKRYLHYSLFDFGKTIIVDESGLQKEKEKAAKKNKKNNDSSYNGVNYKIQIKSSTEPIDNNSKEFKGLKNIVEYYNSERYKYSVGVALSMKEAQKLQDSLRVLFPDAFVVAFNGDKQISISEAKNILHN